MSKLLHPGHPDADQLSAFAEHALPEHERLLTLAHLAECSDCRKIVFLAQQAKQEENLAPHATPSHTPWFKSWNLLWPVAAALSCGLLLIVFTHGRKPAELPQEAALESKSPAPPAPLPPTPVPQTAMAPHAMPSKPLPKKILPSASPKPASPRTTVGTDASFEGNPLSSNRTVNNSSLHGRSTFAITPQLADEKHTSTASVNGAIDNMASQGYPTSSQPASIQRNSLATFSSAQQAPLPSQNQMLSQHAAAPAPQAASPSPQRLAPPSTNQTVEVTNSAPAIQTESAILSAGALDSVASAQKIAIYSLPSKRLAASSISNGHKTLAVDSEGDLFLSKDAGVNWQHIPQQWTGRAIKVTLASSVAKKQLENSKASAGTASATNFGSVSSPSSTKKVGFELTTDTGTTWFSADGLLWGKK